MRIDSTHVWADGWAVLDLGPVGYGPLTAAAPALHRFAATADQEMRLADPPD